jgi:hypothetical protein
MADAFDVAATGNGRFVFTYGNNRLISFARDRAPSCQPVSAEVGQGKAVTIQLGCSDPDGDTPSYTIDTQPTQGVLGTPAADGKVTYVAAASAGSSDSFTYHATAFGVSADPATVTISIPQPAPPVTDADGDGVLVPLDCNDHDASIRPGAHDNPGDGIDQDCNGHDAPLPKLGARLILEARAGRRLTTLTTFAVSRLKGGERVAISCRGKGCPAKGKVVKSAPRGRVSFMKPFRGRHLAVGAKVTVRMTKRGFIGRVTTATMRASKQPRITRLCLAPGRTKPTRCS